MKLQHYLLIGLLSCVSIPLCSCSTGNGASQASVPVDIYIAGANGSTAEYWKNGTPVALPSSLGSGIGNAIAVAGEDIYVAGSVFGDDGSSAADYWKNGVETQLTPTVDASATANAIAVSGQNVYVAGFNGTSAVLWTNGTPALLLDGTDPYSQPNHTYASSMSIAGSDVYVAGTVQKYIQIAPNHYWTGLVAAYWKNGVPVELTQLTENGPTPIPESIFIAGTDVYVAGYSSDSVSNATAVYWKNGIQVTLNPAFSLANSIVVSGSNVYVAGTIAQGTNGYWLNGNPTALVAATGFNLMSQVAVNGSDVYTVGSSANNVTEYWKNGVSTLLTDGSTESSANAIVLIPQS